MSEQRIKGQEAEFRVTDNRGGHVNTLGDVKNFEIAIMLELLSEGYTGQTSEKKDEAYKGIRGKATIHFSDPTMFDFFQRIVDRARRTPESHGYAVNATAILRFPSGRTRVIDIPNIFLGEVPMNIGSRTDYISVDIEFQAENHSFRAAA